MKRSVTISDEVYERLKRRARRQGYNPGEYMRIVLTNMAVSGNPWGTPSEPDGNPATGEQSTEEGFQREPDGNPTGTRREPEGNPAGGTIGGESVEVDVPPTATPSTEEEQQGGAGGRRKSQTWRDVEVPEVLRCETFDGLWEEWGCHRREKGSRLTPTAARRQLKKLEGIGVERAILALNSSLANGYTGIFEPNVTIPPNGRTAARPHTPGSDESRLERAREIDRQLGFGDAS